MYNLDYDDYTYDAPRDPEIIALEERMENAKEFYEALYTELTSAKPIDLRAVQNYMCEIAGYLDMNDSRFGPLTIDRMTGV